MTMDPTISNPDRSKRSFRGPLRRRVRALPLALLGLASAIAWAPLAGQQRILDDETLPRPEREAIVAFLNDPATLLFDGGGRVPGPRTLEGAVGVLGGTFVLAGIVDGDLVVVNGNLRLEPGSRVAGDVTVVGGGVQGAADAEIDGTLTVSTPRLRIVREGGRVLLLEPGDRTEEGFSPSLGFGRSRFTVRAGTNYNRVEGLPVMFGPIVETASSNPLRLEALGVWRTGRGLNLDTGEMGYRVSLEQYLGGRELFSVGASAFSLVEPMEEWGLTDLEASLATFLFHRDFRDYYERVGWSGSLRMQSPDLPLGFELQYRDEDHRFVPSGSPWSLKANDDPWRPTPLVATGRIRSLRTTLALDTRNDREEPTHGWWIQTRSTIGVDGAVEIPGHVTPYAPGPAGEDPPGISLIPPRPVDATFATGFVDARRYNRVGPTSELVVRAVLGGSLTGDPVPPQFQHALGGEGSLPGFPLFSVDCGARAGTAGLDLGGPSRESVALQYGCDRMALFQAEFRGDLGWSFDLGDGGAATEGGGQPVDWGTGREIRPRWAAFFNAGRGWSLEPEGDPSIRFDERSRLDAGLGLLVRGMGLYVAFPLSGEDRRTNLFLRLHRRF